MKPQPLLFVVLLVAAASFASSCGDRTATGPNPAPTPAFAHGFAMAARPATNGALGGVALCPNFTSSTVTQSIGQAGGVIGLGPDTLRIPPGALGHTVAIQATMLTGYVGNLIVFKPDGLVFQKPVLLSVSYANCSLLDPALLRVVQVDAWLQILQYLETTIDVARGKATGVLRHFSNYAVAW